MNKKIYVIFSLILIVFFVVGFQIGKAKSNRPNFKNSFNMDKNMGFDKMQNGDTRKPSNLSVLGEIIDKDDSSITLKQNDSSTKILIISNETEIFKSINVTQNDLKIGDKIVADTKNNNDILEATTLRLVDHLPIRERIQEHQNN